MAESNVVVSFADAVLPGTREVTANVSHWSLSEYCTCHEWMLDARQFMDMLLDGQSKTMVDRRSMRHDTDTGA